MNRSWLARTLHVFKQESIWIWQKQKVDKQPPLLASIPAVDATATDGLGNPKNSHENQPASGSRAGRARIYKQLLAGAGAGGRGWEASGKRRVAANSAANDEGRGSPRAAVAVTAAALLLLLVAAAVGAGGADDAGAEVEAAAEVGLEATRSQEGHMERVVAGRCM